MNAELFAEEVHTVVCQLSNWMKTETLDPDRLMPAMAVVLGRLMSRQASDEIELKTMMEMAINAMTASALEDWQFKTQAQAFPH